MRGAGELGGKVGEADKFLGPCVATGGEPRPTGKAPERERAGF